MIIQMKLHDETNSKLHSRLKTQVRHFFCMRRLKKFLLSFLAIFGILGFTCTVAWMMMTIKPSSMSDPLDFGLFGSGGTTIVAKLSKIEDLTASSMDFAPRENNEGVLPELSSNVMKSTQPRPEDVKSTQPRPEDIKPTQPKPNDVKENWMSEYVKDKVYYPAVRKKEIPGTSLRFRRR